jgi:indolepyruvate ferredoxin oxidoreductase beta subunit
MKGQGTPLCDPYNLIITGVGGQGNVLASRIVGEMLTEMGYHVTIGEIFGASQRGGSVMSHLRISAETTFSPQIPKGKAHLVVALEPTEAVRVLKDYGNPDVYVICNTRPIHAIGVICGEQSYPSPPDLKSWIRELSASAWFIDTTKAAMELGDPIFGNVIAVGALAGTSVLPLDREAFGAVVSRRFPADKAAVNLTAFDRGKELIGNDTNAAKNI